MDELKTIRGTDIPITTRAVVYLCNLNYQTNELKVVGEGLFDNAWEGLVVYSEVPNPESQMVSGETFDELIINLLRLHKNMKDPNWVEDLKNYI